MILTTQFLFFISCRLIKQLDRANSPAVELAYAPSMSLPLTADIRIRVRARIIRITRTRAATRRIVPIAPCQQWEITTVCSSKQKALTNHYRFIRA